MRLRTPSSPLTLPEEPEALIRLSCYEPSGFEAVWTESDLVQHVLLIGMTGSGKTSQLRRMLRQLIAHQAGNSQERIGLCILDPKVDDTVAQVKAMARGAGREADVVVLGPDGDHTLDLFASLRSLADVDQMARRLTSGSNSMGPNNSFWDEYRLAMLDAALTLLVIQGTPVGYREAMDFLRRLYFQDQAVDELVKQALATAKNALRWATPATHAKVNQAVGLVSNWRLMDVRTRSNFQATLMNAIRPLVNVSASRCFEARGRPAFDLRRIVDEGAIGVVSVNALTEPGLAALVFKLAQEQFFQVVQARNAGRHRLCGFIADEWPLVVTPSDSENLATIRSKRCFFVAASQGLAGLDDRVGTRVRRALVSHFGSLVLFRTREEEVDVMAAVHFGTTPSAPKPKTESLGDILTVDFTRGDWSWAQAPVCPPGTLGRLAPHQAFVSLPSARPHPGPVWFVPAFEEPNLLVEEALPDPSLANTDDSDQAARLMGLLNRLGHRPVLSRDVLLALLARECDTGERDHVLAETHSFFGSFPGPLGLESLPLPWLKAIPGIVRKLRHRMRGVLFPRIRRLTQFEGLLLVDFADPSVDPDVADQVRVSLNGSLYPSFWRELRPLQAVRLKAQRPDLAPLLDQSVSIPTLPG